MSTSVDLLSAIPSRILFDHVRARKCLTYRKRTRRLKNTRLWVSRVLVLKIKRIVWWRCRLSYKSWHRRSEVLDFFHSHWQVRIWSLFGLLFCIIAFTKSEKGGWNVYKQLARTPFLPKPKHKEGCAKVAQELVLRASIDIFRPWTTWLNIL